MARATNPKRSGSECVGYEPDPDLVPCPPEEIEPTILHRFLEQVARYADRPQ